MTHGLPCSHMYWFLSFFLLLNVELHFLMFWYIQISTPSEKHMVILIALIWWTYETSVLDWHNHPFHFHLWWFKGKVRGFNHILCFFTFRRLNILWIFCMPLSSTHSSLGFRSCTWSCQFDLLFLHSVHLPFRRFPWKYQEYDLRRRWIWIPLQHQQLGYVLLQPFFGWICIHSLSETWSPSNFLVKHQHYPWYHWLKRGRQVTALLLLLRRSCLLPIELKSLLRFPYAFLLLLVLDWIKYFHPTSWWNPSWSDWSHWLLSLAKEPGLAEECLLAKNLCRA